MQTNNYLYTQILRMTQTVLQKSNRHGCAFFPPELWIAHTEADTERFV